MMLHTRTRVYTHTPLQMDTQIRRTHIRITGQESLSDKAHSACWVSHKASVLVNYTNSCNDPIPHIFLNLLSVLATIKLKSQRQWRVMNIMHEFLYWNVSTLHADTDTPSHPVSPLGPGLDYHCRLVSGDNCAALGSLQRKTFPFSPGLSVLDCSVCWRLCVPAPLLIQLCQIPDTHSSWHVDPSPFTFTQRLHC